MLQDRGEQVLGGDGGLLGLVPGLQRLIGQVEFDGVHQGVASRRYPLGFVPPRGLGPLNVGIGASEAALGVQGGHHRQEGAGLAGLARGVEHEIAFGSDQVLDFIPVHPLQGWNSVMMLWLDRAGGIEEFFQSLSTQAVELALRLLADAVVGSQIPCLFQGCARPGRVAGPGADETEGEPDALEVR